MSESQNTSPCKGGSLYITSTEQGSGKALVSLGVIDIVMRSISKVGFFRPIIQSRTAASHESNDYVEFYNSAEEEDNDVHDEDIDFITGHFRLNQTYDESFGMSTDQAAKLLGENREDDLLDVIIGKYKALEAKCDFIVCEGSDYLSKGSAVEFNLNQVIAKNLGCPIVILGSAHDRPIAEACQQISISVDSYRSYEANVVGICLNKADPDNVQSLKAELERLYKEDGYSLCVIPADKRLSCPRMSDVVKHLKGHVLSGHNYMNGLVRCSLVCAMQLQNALKWLKEDDTLLVTSGDRGDIVVGALQAHQSRNYPRLAGIILTGGVLPEPSILRLIEGLPARLPIVSVQTGTFEAASQINAVHARLRSTDQEKISLSIQAFEEHLVDTKAFERKILPDANNQSPTNRVNKVITPKMFMYSLVEQSKAKKQHIVMPEGTDPRILKAAAILVERDIVNITLLGNKEKISNYVSQYGIDLNLDRLKVVDPVSSGEALEKYANMYYELRKHKGTVPNIDAARDECLDLSCFGTMMVHCGDANGMVSGARHTTQHTIRPALQIIKTKPGFKIVSSVFLMCLDHHVLVYGDCAVNPNPSAEQLADIALASAETAQTFGIEPKVAMLSYSSGDSGKGDEVEKVREATRIAKERRPDLLIEGPIQYDAAVDKDVAASKMPNSPVAGQATVFVFPDLNTGNNTYKAVQRETGAIAIGPVLQGLKKPVNDLSRGCTVEDIVNTVVITACQGQQIPSV
ncbi:Phosphate acetyltransferase [Seminavis robusta]|uniref:Phosphate acetyltransferase n=1 Tax=Seminavis robusta TaxID=568900 RepID=A0A9N8HP95_9STRA|nr:Phosphate acetyltransferase [Seminavis robusta]|eukprot:Sro1303_g261010.1 Phosphate acetyltransferase (746) ;mRNA; f:18459-20798